jgi:hypothetical protein
LKQKLPKNTFTFILSNIFREKENTFIHKTIHSNKTFKFQRFLRSFLFFCMFPLKFHSSIFSFSSHNVATISRVFNRVMTSSILFFRCLMKKIRRVKKIGLFLIKKIIVCSYYSLNTHILHFFQLIPNVHT